MKAFLKYFTIGALVTLLGCLNALYGYWIGLCFSNIHTIESNWGAIFCFFLTLIQLAFLLMSITAVGGIVMCKKSSKENNNEELS